MTHRICRSYRFESAHQLRGVPPGHKCANMHGHTYRVDVVLSGAPNATGMVKDFAEMDLVCEAAWLRALDHKVLNHFPSLEDNPTAENIASYIGSSLKHVWPEIPITVRVYENPDMWAETSL